MARPSTGESRKQTAIKFSSAMQSELDACQRAASQRAGVQSLPMSTILNEVVTLGLPLYKERIGLTSKPSKPTPPKAA